MLNEEKLMQRKKNVLDKQICISFRQKQAIYTIYEKT